jgi:hypothetical protein
LNNYSGKRKCANDLKFCAKISGLSLHQMVHLSGKKFLSHHVKKPQWSPFNKHLVIFVKETGLKYVTLTIPHFIPYKIILNSKMNERILYVSILSVLETLINPFLKSTGGNSTVKKLSISQLSVLFNPVYQ